jgi:hypothetical protein
MLSFPRWAPQIGVSVRAAANYHSNADGVAWYFVPRNWPEVTFSLLDPAIPADTALLIASTFASPSS